MHHVRTFPLLPAGWVSAAWVVLLIGLTVTMLTFAVMQTAAPAVEPIVASTEPYIEYVPNTLWLRLKPGVTPASGQASRSSAVGVERVYRVQWTASIPVEHAVAALAADVAVEYAEPDDVARPARIPDAPEYASQWALARINAPPQVTPSSEWVCRRQSGFSDCIGQQLRTPTLTGVLA
ncbi:MAG: hypothetical protein ACOYL7_03515 [Caldilinea sp.]